MEAPSVHRSCQKGHPCIEQGGFSTALRPTDTRTFPCISSRMVSVTFKPPSMTPVSILSCVGLSQALSVVRSLVAG